MTVRENVAFGLTINKTPRAIKEAKVAEAARVLQMEHLMQRRPSELSGGQRQRVAIGRAIVRDPKVFLFDEPLSNLDAALRMDMRMEIGKLHQSLKASMIYVTHDQVEAMTLADKIVVLKDGEVMQIGSPMDLYHPPTTLLVAGFLGAPSMNFITVDVREAGGERATVANASLDPIAVPTAGRPVRAGAKATMGIRPQYLVPTEPDKGMLHGTVSLIERLGSETVIDMTLRDGSKIIAAIAEDKVMQPGTEIALAFDPGQAHLFPSVQQRN
jgi:multiple sugar transport system ATP-binding protein